MIDEKKLIAAIEAYAKDKTAKGCWYDRLWGLHMAIEIINAQPKAVGWIPCSERLPEKDGIYIVDDRVFNSPWIHTAGFKVSSQAWCENHGVYYDDKYGRYEDGRVTAWQPLPAPWEGEDDV